MRLFVYLLSCVLLICFASFFFIKKPDGHPWLTINKFIPNTNFTNQAKTFSKNLINKTKSIVGVENSTTIYKWKDEQGVWHYSDKPLSKTPGENISKATVWNVPNNLTVIPVEKPFIPLKNINNPTNTDKNNSDHNIPVSSKVSTLINDAKGIQKLMDQRTKMINENL